MILRPPAHRVRPPPPSGRPQIFGVKPAPRKLVKPPPAAPPAPPPAVKAVAAPVLPASTHRLRVVFPVCNKDAHLLAANLEWMHELDGPSEFAAVLALDASLQARARGELTAALAKAFPKHAIFEHPVPPIRSWPQAPNWVFQHVALAMKQGGQPWLWMEPDAWALKPGCLAVLEKAYIQSGKFVMGPVVKGMGHVNGVSIYPANFCDLSPRAMGASNAAWDSQFVYDLNNQIADAANLMQHAWGNDPDGNGFTQWGGSGAPTFKSPEALKWITPSAVLFHRCKDISLVTQLRRSQPRVVARPVSGATIPKVEIIIVSYLPDLEWLKFNLRSIAKFAIGFSGVTLAVPERDKAAFAGLSNLCQFRLVGRPAGDTAQDFNHHMVAKMRADELCPEADFILHTDSDCIFTGPVRPQDYFQGGKPELLIESWAHVTSSALQWKDGVDRAIGFNSTRETMRRHPAVHYRGVYGDLRRRVEALHKVPFADYVISQSQVSEFNWIGNFILNAPEWRDKYHWIDRDKEPAPPSSRKLVQFWSRRPPSEPQPCPTTGRIQTPLEIINRILA